MDSQVDKDALTTKLTELIKVSLNVVTDCRPCIEFHIGRAAQSGACLREVLESIEIAVRSRGASAADTVNFARDVARRVFEKRPIRASILAKTRW
jgi:AhpD family alkylhydroperoxidase